MKFVLPALLSVAVLVAVPHAEARTFGGFKRGDSFKLKVVGVESSRYTYSSGTDVASPIPGGIPKFRKNQVITFRIGAKGRLVAPRGVSIPFSHSKGGVNEYDRAARGGTASQNAEIKRKGKRVSSGSLLFIKDDGTYRDVVSYRLKR
jgi:hypothetical protein